MRSGEIGPGMRRFRETRDRGEYPDAGAIAREHPGEALSIADELIRVEALNWARAREEMWMARLDVEVAVGRDADLGTALRNAREDRGITIRTLVATMRDRGSDIDRGTVELLEGNRIAVTEIGPAIWAAMIDDIEITRAELVATIWFALIEVGEDQHLTRTGRRARSIDTVKRDYLDRVRRALGLPVGATDAELRRRARRRIQRHQRP